MYHSSSPFCRPLLAGWLGGKSRLAKQIISQIPAHKCYVEPFAGAAWVLFRKAESPVEVLNDINNDVMNLYRVAQYHTEELVRQFRFLLVSRAEFDRLKQLPPIVLTDVQRAARFLYLQQAAFGGKLRTASFGTSKKQKPSLNLGLLESWLLAVRDRLCRAYLECLPYSDLITRYDSADTFFYIDPPYFGHEEDYGKNIFCAEDFRKLAHQLAAVKGKFLLSINDTAEMRTAFNAFFLERVKTTYSSGPNGQQVHELFVSNYRV